MWFFIVLFHRYKGNGCFRHGDVYRGIERGRGVSFGRGACPFFRREGIRALGNRVLGVFFRAVVALPSARQKARRIRGRAVVALPESWKICARVPVPVGVRPLRGHAGGTRRARPVALSAPVRHGTFCRPALCPPRDAWDLSAQLRARSLSALFRLFLRRRNAVFRRRRGGGSVPVGIRVCGDERHSLRARAHGRGQNGETTRPLRSALGGRAGGGHGLHPREDLRRGRTPCGASLSERHAREQNLFSRLGACGSHVPRLGAVSAASPVRKDRKRARKKRRKGGNPACGVCPVPAGTFRHCAVLLSRDGDCGTCLFSCLHF